MQINQSSSVYIVFIYHILEVAPGTNQGFFKMEQNRVDMFIASSGEKFPSEKLMLVRDQLMRLDDSKFTVIQSVEYKAPTTMLIISLFGGSLGIDRFMLGDTGLGVVKLLTCGGLGIWTIIDWFTIMSRTKESNYKKFAQFAI